MSKRYQKAVLLTLSAAMIAMAVPQGNGTLVRESLAVTTSADDQAQIDDLNSQYDELKEQQQELQAQIDQAKSEKDKYLAQKNQLDGQINNTQQQINVLTS